MAYGAKQSETSEIVDAVSRLVGAFVGTVAAVGRKFAGRSSKSTAPVRRLTLSGRVTALESGLAAVRRDVDKLLGKGKPAKQKKKSPTKTDRSHRQQNEASKQSGGETTAQENQPPRKDAQMSKNDSSETDTSPGSAP